MIVRFCGKQVVIPRGYKMAGENCFISSGGTKYKLVSVDEKTIKMEAVDSGRRRLSPLEVIGSDESMSTLQFLNNYLKCKANISIHDNNGIVLYNGTVADLPRSIVDNSVITGIKGLGNMHEIIIGIDYLTYDK